MDVLFSSNPTVEEGTERVYRDNVIAIRFELYPKEDKLLKTMKVYNFNHFTLKYKFFRVRQGIWNLMVLICGKQDLRLLQ